MEEPCGVRTSHSSTGAASFSRAWISIVSIRPAVCRRHDGPGLGRAHRIAAAIEPRTGSVHPDERDKHFESGAGHRSKPSHDPRPRLATGLPILSVGMQLWGSLEPRLHTIDRSDQDQHLSDCVRCAEPWSRYGLRNMLRSETCPFRKRILVEAGDRQTISTASGSRRVSAPRLRGGCVPPFRVAAGSTACARTIGGGARTGGHAGGVSVGCKALNRREVQKGWSAMA